MRWTTRRELIAVTLVAAGFLTLRLYFALRSATMVMIPDEYIYSEIAYSLAHEGSATIRDASAGFPALLYPLSIAPFWGLFGIDTAYHLSQALNALCASLAAVPAYLLCRQLGFRPLLRVGISILAIAVPGLAFTSYVMADPLGYLLALSAVAAGVKALARPGWRFELLYLVLAGLATFTRIQYVFLLGVFPLAALLGEPRRPLAAVRRFRLTFALAGAAVLVALAIGLSSVFGYYKGVLHLHLHPLELVRWIGSDLYVLIFAVGVFVVPGALIGLALALTRPHKPEERAFALLALLTAACLLIEAGFYASNGSDRVQERYLLLLLPLVAVAFGIAADHARGGWMAAAVISTAILLTMLSYPISGFNAAVKVQDSPTLGAILQLQNRFGSGNAALAVTTVAMALLALAVAASTRPRILLPLGLGLSLAFLSAGSAIAGHRFRTNSNRVAAYFLPPDRDAIDSLSLGPVTYLRTSPNARTETVELMFWNRSIRTIAGLARTGPVDAYGFTPARVDDSGRLLIAGKPPGGPIVVDTYGTSSTVSGGRLIYATKQYQVWQPRPRLRFGLMVQGLFYDGWLGAWGSVDVWPDTSGWSRGVLHLVLGNPVDGKKSGLVFVGLPHSYQVDVGPGRPRRLDIPIDVHGKVHLSFEASRADTAPGGRFVSVHARIWLTRKLAPSATSTNVAAVGNR